jgi:hypothetical protein
LCCEGLVDDLPLAVDARQREEVGERERAPEAVFLDRRGRGVADLLDGDEARLVVVPSTSAGRLLASAKNSSMGTSIRRPARLPNIRASGWNARRSLSASPSREPSM